MKKLYISALLLISALSFGQSIVITRVVDGTLPSDGCEATTGGSSSPKIVELYVSGTADMSYYRLQTESNGAADEASINWNNGAYLNDLGTVTDAFVYLVYGSSDGTLPVFNDAFPSITDNVLISNQMPNMNGNDALRVVQYSEPSPAGDMVAVIDQFANPLDLPENNYDVAWAYDNSYAARNNDVPANGGDFDVNSFTYGGSGNFDSPNNTCSYIANAVTLGSWSMTSGVKNFDTIVGLKMFPNPLNGNVLNITSANNAEKTVAIYDIVGKQVLNTVTTGTVNAAGLNAGVYIVKITEEGKTATRKLVVK